MIPIFQLIRDHRRIAGLTQAQLARLAGVGKTVVWDLEHGKESVQWDTLQKIFHVLNVSVEWRSPLLERKASKAEPKASSFPAPSPRRPRSK
jgi:transcriptional regulator with XRE-family HTH domain